VQRHLRRKKKGKLGLAIANSQLPIVGGWSFSNCWLAASASRLPASKISLCNRFPPKRQGKDAVQDKDGNGMRGKRFVANNWIFQLTPTNAYFGRVMANSIRFVRENTQCLG